MNPSKWSPPNYDNPTIDDQFRNWYRHVFGDGYGSAEPVVVSLMKKFFEHVEGYDGRGYNTYDMQEQGWDEGQLWLLVALLDKGGCLEWGTSIRIGWIRCQTELVRDYLRDKSREDVLELLMGDHMDDEDESTLAQPCFDESCEGGFFSTNPMVTKTP